MNSSINEGYSPGNGGGDFPNSRDSLFSSEETIAITNSSFNRTTLPSLVWTWQKTLLSIPLATVVMITILGNFLILYSIVQRPQSLRLPAHFLIANLALADFLVGVLCIPFLATLQLTGSWYFGPGYCEAWTVIHTWLCSASILSTLAICVERYIGVRWPLDHRLIMNRKRVWSLLITVWTFAGTFTLFALYTFPQPKTGKEFACDLNLQIGFVLVVKFGMPYVPAVAMVILYWKIFAIASKHLKPQKETLSFGMRARDSSISQSEVMIETSISVLESENAEPKKINGQSNRFSVNNEKNVLAKYEAKMQINLAKKLIVLVALVLLSYIPFFTIYVILAFRPEVVNSTVFDVFSWLRYLNSCVNPFVYAFAVPAYRKSMRETVAGAMEKVKIVWVCGQRETRM